MRKGLLALLIFSAALFIFCLWKIIKAERFMIAEGRKLGLECFIINSNTIDFGPEFPADVEARKGNTFYIWRHGSTHGNNTFSEHEFDSNSYSLRDCKMSNARKF